MQRTNISKKNNKLFTGRVVSTKMKNTIVVEIVHTRPHPMYKKIMKKTKRILAHNDKLEIHEGDSVVIRETRPLSRNKHFEVVKKIE